MAAGEQEAEARPGAMPWRRAAAGASIAAGLLHAAAAGSHGGDPTLPLVFAIAAVLQVGWGVLALGRAGRWSDLTGAVINLVAVVAWALSRTVGLPVVDGLADVEPVGVEDSIAAGLAASAILGALAATGGWRSPSLAARPAGTALGATVLAALAVGGMASGHADGPSHAHEHGHEEAGAEPAADVSSSPVEAAGAGPILSLDDARVTASQRQAARELIDRTTAATASLSDVAAAQAAGYRSIGDASTGFEHFVHVDHLVDGRVLDADAVESLVFAVDADGSRRLVSAMYILEAGATMADVPDIAGELTTWHDHQDLCWEGGRVVGRLVDGRCGRGRFVPTPPMLHVWLVEQPCGPFAGLDGHGGTCGEAGVAPPRPASPAAQSDDAGAEPHHVAPQEGGGHSHGPGDTVHDHAGD